MNDEIEKIFTEILKNQIYEELLIHKKNYDMNEDIFKKQIKDLINKKYNFVIIEPSKIRNLKSKYYQKYNKLPRGPKANDIKWLESKIENIDLDDNICLTTKYKPRYVSRKHFDKKKDKCMARIWNDHYGGQCSRKKTKGDYCTVHKNIIEKKGLLQFGRIDEPRPERDYFNHHKLNWKS